MAVTWDWNTKVGYYELEQKHGEDTRTFRVEMYGGGNCPFVEIWENKSDNTYQVQGFWVDKEHGKRMLGLSKNYDGKKENLYENDYNHITKVVLNPLVKGYKDIADLWARAEYDVLLSAKEFKGVKEND